MKPGGLEIQSLFWKDPSIHLGSSGFPVSTTRKLVVKNRPASSGDIRDLGLIPGLGKSPEGGHGNTLQYSCLENSMDRGAWRAMVCRVTKGLRRLKLLSMHTCTSVQ